MLGRRGQAGTRRPHLHAPEPAAHARQSFPDRVFLAVTRVEPERDAAADGHIVGRVLWKVTRA